MRKDVWADDLAQDVACHVLGCDRLTVARSGGEVTAFVAASLKKMEGETIYHLEGVIVEPEYHNSGLGRQLIERDMAETQSSVLAFHTQSKKMLALGNKLAYLNNQDAVYYSRIINTRMLSVTESGLIVDHQRYGGNCLYGDINQFAQVAVEGIDWQQGDALVCAGRIK
jgi:GNAT superfamily N-acetyltransferase